MKVELEEDEILCLLEGCAASTHMQQALWTRAVNEFYHKLTKAETDWLYTYAKRDVTKHYADCIVGQTEFFKFLCRYNPANKYRVVAEGIVEGERQKIRTSAFKFNGSIWVDSMHTVKPDYIEKVELEKTEMCSNGQCPLCATCARYTADKSASKWYYHETCDWYINKNTEHGADVEVFIR